MTRRNNKLLYVALRDNPNGFRGEPELVVDTWFTAPYSKEGQFELLGTTKLGALHPRPVR